jgi:hypothetical protein
MESPQLKPNDIIMIINMDDVDAVEPLTLGRVIKVDDKDQYKWHIEWENGRTLPILQDIDKWETEESLIEKNLTKQLNLFRYKLRNLNK